MPLGLFIMQSNLLLSWSCLGIVAVGTIDIQCDKIFIEKKNDLVCIIQKLFFFWKQWYTELYVNYFHKWNYQINTVNGQAGVHKLWRLALAIALREFPKKKGIRDVDR